MDAFSSNFNTALTLQFPGQHCIFLKDIERISRLVKKKKHQ